MIGLSKRFKLLADRRGVYVLNDEVAAMLAMSRLAVAAAAR
ncbi:MAG TPA: hypothetical protein VKP67_19615 [Xanthobacteraceae bacterium]|nr:hypothetical protein [Xanthobacteraceae bacterium]